MTALPKEITEIIENPGENQEMHEEGLELKGYVMKRPDHTIPSSSKNGNANTRWSYWKETDSVSAKTTLDDGRHGGLVESTFETFEKIYLGLKKKRDECRKKLS